MWMNAVQVCAVPTVCVPILPGAMFVSVMKDSAVRVPSTTAQPQVSASRGSINPCSVAMLKVSAENTIHAVLLCLESL